MKLKKIFAVSLCAMSFHSYASPWVTAEDNLLKHSIDLLVSYGLINRPVNQYPLLWQGIASDLQQIDSTQLNNETAFAVSHLRHALNHAKQETSSGIKAHFTEHPQSNSGMGENPREKSGLTTFGQITGSNVSARVQVNYADDAVDGKYVNHHGSHLAILLGDWSLSAERLDYWWGPGNETALLLSNNATPMKAVRLSRANTNYSGPQFLSFIGPWQITAIAAKQKPHDKEGDFWGARFSSTPIKGLELGFATTGSDFIFAQLDTTTEVKKRRITSIDFKYSSVINQLPFAVYAEYSGDNDTGVMPDEALFSAGIETYWSKEDYRIKGFIEYSDTTTDCLAESASFQCNFQHFGKGSDYKEYGQWLGAGIGPQAKSITLAADYFQIEGSGAYAKLKLTEFESMELDRSLIEVGYQQALWKGLFKTSLTIWKDETKQQDDTHQSLGLSWEYRY
ncbi:capsule assembly Wzi family protein [Pseudoalteromonas luteoviolacea]|uniref:capsule assembly Wzi family protein n=1 Tax=Pseudoalteromonas luteoviolacea TaxID=43657 RepID=UPI001F34D55E|nr:capsule assembly Wzi family protein [Pseudoalteromonas luteoviolacea]MCF6439009.1 capsule assembly Wzi family protein [Pseudoalteromonas luteoviolacea]